MDVSMMVQWLKRDQLAGTPSGVPASEEAVLGASFWGEGLSCSEHGESDRRDGAEIHCGARR